MQLIVHSTRENKHLLISVRILESSLLLVTVYGQGGRSIVFTQTKADANNLMSSATVLGGRSSIEVMHGDISQYQREQTLRKFREGKIKVLVATDVASRGLDIPDVELIVQVEPPQDVEAYIHRSGRTARAGREGKCITFFSRKNEYIMEQIEMRAGIKFTHIDIPSSDEVAAKQKERKNVVKMIQRMENFNARDHLDEAKELLDGCNGDT